MDWILGCRRVPNFHGPLPLSVPGVTSKDVHRSRLDPRKNLRNGRSEVAIQEK